MSASARAVWDRAPVTRERRPLQLVRLAAGHLRRCGAASPRLDAELLLADALGCTRLELYLRFDQTVSSDQLRDFRGLCRRRARGEPLAYVLARKHFMGVDLEVTPSVLIPRPETEVLVEAALRLLSAGVPARVLDVGTGSGAIVLALLAARPQARGVATDVSPAALEVASRNAVRLGLAPRVDFRQTDLAAGVAGPFELVTANLPYVVDGTPEVEQQVRVWEPPEALYGGPDGLDQIRRLTPLLPELLVTDGAALIEFDPRQRDAILDIADAVGEAAILKDLAGRDRVLMLRCRPTAGQDLTRHEAQSCCRAW